MRKIIGIGEPIMDIIFKDGQPTAAVPGGSVFNGAISLGRLGQKVSMITETGNDKVGEIIKNFMNKDDIVMMGSYFVLNPVLRTKVKEFLEYARQQGAFIYYDINFRPTHKDEAIKLYPNILENFEYADIVRGSTEDFMNMFDISDPIEAYESKVCFHCKTMICTDADGDIQLITPSLRKTYPVEKIQTVSTIGAGDNFNAGVVYGLMRNNVGANDLDTLSETTWDKVVNMGQRLALDVCQSFNNSISHELAEKLKQE